MKKSQTILFLVLLSFGGSSTAISLGQQRGAALIGRPLDFSVQAVLDAQEDPARLCLDADVSFGDSKLEKSKIRITAEKSLSTPQGTTIFIRSSALVDEPVVTLLLRVGCQQKTERRYVVLTDFAPELIEQASAGLSPGTGRQAGPLAAMPGNLTTGASGVASATGKPFNAPGLASFATRTQSRVDVSATRRNVQPMAAKSSEKSQPRLRLQSLDLAMERSPSLKPSSDLLSLPASTDQERSVAAALWRALTAQPQDLLRDAEKLQALEASVLSLRAQSQKNLSTITDLNSQIQKAQKERFSNPLVYVLGLLLILALASLAYLWSRRSLAGKSGPDELPWWRKNKPLEKGWANSHGDLAASRSADRSKFKRGSGDSSLDRDFGLNQSGFTEVKHLSEPGYPDLGAGQTRKGRPDFAASLSHASRAIKAEELFDVQQQADFFVSLGQHEQAIQVLRNHIAENLQTSALVFLDLFNLYHQLKRQADYEALREDFKQRFNAEVPAFDLYTDAGPGLEAYDAALARIEAIWPSPRVLEIIEESIFRGPDASEKPFGLEAYRELLLLFAIAKEIIGTSSNTDGTLPNDDFSEAWLIGTVPIPLKFVSTSIQPLSASAAYDGQPETLTGLSSVLPKASPRLGLDINLDEFSGDAQNLLSGVESDSHFFAQFVTKAAGSLPARPPAPTIPSKSASTLGSLPDIDR